MVRRDLLNKVGLFDENLKNIAEDLHLIVRMAKKCHVAYIDKPMAKLRRHGDCLSLNIDGRSAEKAYLLILREVFEDPLLGCQFRSLRRIAQFNFFRRVAFYSYGNDMKLTRSYLIKALVAHPRGLVELKGLELIYVYIKSLTRLG
jgi:hypothetical protein